MNIPFDIETLPTNDDELISSFANTIKPPAKFTKPESIAEWMQANKDDAIAELVSKTSFDGLYGRVACIAWQIEDGEVLATLPYGSEGDNIQRFYDGIASKHSSGDFSSSDTFIGHNVAGFDLPFLKHRSIILGIKPPANIRKAMSAKQWDSCIADTMLMWSSDSQKRVSMDKLCRAFGIPGKGDFDGSMVANEWANGSREKVIDYCKDDVRRTWEMYQRITFKDKIGKD